MRVNMTLSLTTEWGNNTYAYILNKLDTKFFAKTIVKINTLC